MLFTAKLVACSIMLPAKRFGFKNSNLVEFSLGKGGTSHFSTTVAKPAA
jgi:hypothetical protein